jgi:heat shock protein HslJ
MRTMKLKITLVVGVIGVTGLAWSGVAAEPPAAGVPAVPDGHTSRTALDWAGRYEGLLLGADGAGVVTRLTLAKDDTFVLESQVVRAGVEAVTVRGMFQWLPDGNSVQLDAAGGGRRFAVGEGRLTEWNRNGSPPKPNAAGQSLRQVPAEPDTSAAGTADQLVRHRWRLASALTGANERIDALFPALAPFEFHFTETSLQVKGGCNGFRGRYEINEAGRLVATPLASTLMACPPALMEADQTMGALLAKPLGLTLVRGTEPTLVLISDESEVLMLSGSLTPEALYGPPTLVFLEVAADTVPCPEPDQATPCLNVRELRFNDQGIRVGEPGAWQPFAGSIEGFQHTPGVRHVLRVKRFQPPAEAPAVHVLDLIVESETVKR